MLQTITVIIILLLAAAAAGSWIRRFFTRSVTSGCSPDRCASCPYSGQPCGCRQGTEKK